MEKKQKRFNKKRKSELKPKSKITGRNKPFDFDSMEIVYVTPPSYMVNVRRAIINWFGEEIAELLKEMRTKPEDKKGQLGLDLDDPS